VTYGFTSLPFGYNGHTKAMSLTDLMAARTVTSKQGARKTVSPYLGVEDYGM